MVLPKMFRRFPKKKRIKIKKGGKGWLGRQIESGEGVCREDQKSGGSKKWKERWVGVKKVRGGQKNKK